MKFTIFLRSFFVLLFIWAPYGLSIAKPKAPKKAAAPAAKQTDEQKLKLAMQKATAAVKKIDTYAARLKAKPQLDTTKPTAQTKFQQCITAAQKASEQVKHFKGSPPAMSRMTWEILVGQITWETQAQLNAKKVKTLNAKLTAIAKKLRGKSVSPALATKYQTAVTKLVTQINTAGGTPATSWATIEGSLKTGNSSDTGAAKRIHDKAINIKKSLYAKTYPPEKVALLKKAYTTNRTKVLKLDPAMGKDLVPVEQLPLHSGSTGDVDPKKLADQKFTNSLKKLKTINDVLKKGVTTAELDTQKTKFDKESINATKLKAAAKRTDTIPTMVQAKIIEASAAVKKYLDAVASVDRDLATKKMGIAARSPKEISDLQVKRAKLIKQAQAIDPSITFPPAPVPGQTPLRGVMQTPGASGPASSSSSTTTVSKDGKTITTTNNNNGGRGPSAPSGSSDAPATPAPSAGSKDTQYAKLDDDNKNAIQTQVVKSGIFGQNKKIVQVGPDGKPIQQVFSQKEMDDAKKEAEKDALRNGRGGGMGMGMGAMAMGGMGGGMGMGMPMGGGMGMGMGGPMMMGAGGMMAGGAMMGAGGMMMSPGMAMASASTVAPVTPTASTAVTAQPTAADFPNLSNISQKELSGIDMPTVMVGPLDSLIASCGFCVVQPANEATTAVK